MAPMQSGTWMTSPPFSLHALICSSLSGASEQPKSTSLPVIMEMPAPEPFDW